MFFPKMSVPCPLNDTAGQSFAGIPGRLGPVIVGIVVDDNRLAHDFIYPELVGKKTHTGSSVIGKQNREIPGMVPMRLIRRVPVPTGGQKRIVWIPHLAYAVFVDMKSMRPYRGLRCGRRLIIGQAGDLYADPCSSYGIPEKYNTADLWPQRTAHHVSNGIQIIPVIPILIQAIASQNISVYSLSVYEGRYPNGVSGDTALPLFAVE